MRRWLWLMALTLPAQEPTAGLVAYWRMDENSGSVAGDSAQAGKHI